MGSTGSQTYKYWKDNIYPYKEKIQDAVEELERIVKIQLEGVKELLKEKDIELFVTDEALQSLVEQGFDPFFGARPIKRLIQKNVLNELSKQLIGGNIDTTNNLVLDAFDGKMVFRKPIYEKEELNH